MKIIDGTCVHPGIVIGKVLVLKKEAASLSGDFCTLNEENERLNKALWQVDNELQILYKQAYDTVGKEEAMIFEGHRLILQDKGFIEKIRKILEQGKNVETAVSEAGREYAMRFSSMADEILKSRGDDIEDVCDRILFALSGKKEKIPKLTEPVIIAAWQLTPSETMQLDKEKVLAFVVAKGSIYSHVSILAKSLNIPCMICPDLSEEETVNRLDGALAVVDTDEGKIVVNPDEDYLLQAKKRQNEWQQECGKQRFIAEELSVRVTCNVQSIDDIPTVLESGADGIGLLRSEYMYLGRDSYPTEDELFQNYKSILEQMGGKRVVIRTLDIGADKCEDYFGFEKEDNPALGLRGIRFCLANPEIFRTQLRAILRASAYGNAAVMFPMITDVKEVQEAKALLQQEKEALRQEKIPIGNLQIGIMIETPAAALMSDELAKEVDFFSIGTNDLTQYTLATDRMSNKMMLYFSEPHEAVLRLVENAVKNAISESIPVDICGEFASNIVLTKRFIELGVKELAVSPSSVPEIKKLISGL